jgi:4-amino-4-deoxy-L-arabinose transferase-like glycosyltransferase
VKLGWLAPALAATAAAVYIVLVAAQMHRPLMYDDANFALAARAVADTGVPFGHQGWMSERGDFSQREQWALWHPPLYIYILGLFAKIGGWTPLVLRLPGLLAALISGALTYRLATDVTHGSADMKRLSGGIAAALVLLAPVTVQSALILDIDLALLLPLTLLFLILYFRLEDARRGWLWLAPLFAVILWSKMTNPLPLLGVLIVWQILRGQPLRAIAHLLGIGGAGALLFLVSWVAIGSVLGFPLDMPFGVNLVQWQDSSAGPQRAALSLGAFIEGLQPTILWLGPGLVALGLGAAALRAPQLLHGWKIVRADVLIGLMLVLSVGYVYKSAGWFPKYQVALIPLVACLAAPLLAHAFWRRPLLVTSVASLATIATGVVYLRLIRDDWNLRRLWAVDDDPSTLWLLAVVAAAVVIGLPWRAAGQTAIAGAFALALGWSLGTDALLVRAHYSTTYWYGTRGTREAAAWVASNVAPDQTYVASKEVAILTPAERFVDQETLVWFLATGRPVTTTWEGAPIRAVVAWQREPYVADLLARTLPPIGFTETARFDDYIVYEPLGLPPAAR